MATKIQRSRTRPIPVLSYSEIAYAIREALEASQNEAPNEITAAIQLRGIVHAASYLASAIEVTNPHLSRGLFFENCGLTP